jgi:hypothetical protein
MGVAMQYHRALGSSRRSPLDKRHQVFVSSTFADLQDARRKVLQALMEMDCIPAGMELFPAADEEQWVFIRKVIDDCDYYLLIIGGRYGSITAEGVSYTELEYAYATEIGIPVLAFLHGKPYELPPDKSDNEPSLRAKLDAFRERVSSGRLVRFWQDPHELPGLVALSLQRTIKTHPRTGWVRADQISSQETLADLNELRKRNEALTLEVLDLKARLSPTSQFPDLAPLEQQVEVAGTYFQAGYSWVPWQVKTNWKALYALIAPSLLSHPHDDEVKAQLARALFPYSGKMPHPQIQPRLDDQHFQTIKVQLMAHRLVSVDYIKSTSGSMGLFWSLTKKGHESLLALRIVRKA